MSVRFKFKNDLDYQPIPCDGFHISVRDLKRSIIRSKKFGKVTDFDLVVTNSQTNHVYLDENELISKNTTLTVQRAPLGEGKKKVWEEETSISASIALASQSSSYSGIPGLSLSQNSLDTEEEKIAKMMNNTGEMYSEKHWTKFKGQRALPDGAKPPPHWKCSKCLANHWVSDCPFANNDMKRTTGIPRSFLKPAESNVPGAKINPQGLIVVNEMEKQAYSEKKIEKNPWLPDDKPAFSKTLVPNELLCPICKDLLKDAVMMPCCAGSACDECARNGIIDSEGSRCPVCTDIANPEELIPYRLFRDKVDKFRNQTGYTKAPNPSPSQPSLSNKPTLPDIVLPDPSDTNFKFDALVGHRAAPGVKVEPPNLNFTFTSNTNGSPNSKEHSTPNDISPHRSHAPTPHTPTSTPPRSPGTPTSSPRRSATPTRRSPSPGTPISSHNETRARDTPTPTTSPQHQQAPIVDTSVPPPLYSGVPGPTLLPPGHVLAPSSHYPPPQPQVAPSHVYYGQPPSVINPAEDPLAAFEAAMRKLDSKKEARGRIGPSSPPRAYRVERQRSRSRGRYRDYRERDYSPNGYRGLSPRRGFSPRRNDRGRSRGSGPRTPSPYSNGDSRNSLNRLPSPGSTRDYRGESQGSKVRGRARYVSDIPPETEEERKDRERFEREMAERERMQKEQERDDQYSNYRRTKGRVAPTPPREFLEGEKNSSGKDPENRTPSLSPEPGTLQHEEYVKRKERRENERGQDCHSRDKGGNERSYQSREEDHDRNGSNQAYKEKENSRERYEKEIRHEERDYDSRDRYDWDSRDERSLREKETNNLKEREAREYRDQREDRDTREYRDRDVRDSRDYRDRDIRDYRDRDLRDHPKDYRDKDVRDFRDRDTRDYRDSRDRDVRSYRDKDSRGSRDRDLRDRNKYHEGEDREYSRERGRERSRDNPERLGDNRESSWERNEIDNKGRNDEQDKDFNDQRGISDHGRENHNEEEKRDSKKEKKNKKSKKKNKKKEKDSDDEEDGKENKKKKKKGKKKKDKDAESNDEDITKDDVKPLVPYLENEEMRTTEESSENQEEKTVVDHSKFINSFSEAKPEENKPKLNLPTLIFNDKTVELAPKASNSNEDNLNCDLKSLTGKLSPRQEVSSTDRKEISNIDNPKKKEKSKERDIIETQEQVPIVASKWDRDDGSLMDYPKQASTKSPKDSEKLKSDNSYDEENKRNSKSDLKSGPQNVLKKALANMEKENFVLEKKRKSLDGSETDKDDEDNSKKKKKKKKKKVESDEDSTDEDTKDKIKKKNKKKKKGGLDIPEKTLKKLLKKNLLKKKALEKLISGDGKKKKKKLKGLEDINDIEYKEIRDQSPVQKQKDDKENDSKDYKKSRSRERRARMSGEERIVRRRESQTPERRGKKFDSKEKEKRSGKRGLGRDSSEEEREVKSSKEGLIQVRLDNSSSSRGNMSSKTSSVQANLLKMAGQATEERKKMERERNSDRQKNSPPRKSIKDRLGPLSGRDSSPSKSLHERSDRFDNGNGRNGDDRLVRRTAALMAVKDRLGGSKEKNGKERDERENHKPPRARERLGAIPADLQEWASKATLPPSKHSDRNQKKNESSDEDRKKDKRRRRSVSREKRNISQDRKRSSFKDRRKSPSVERRRRTPSEERKLKKDKKKERKRGSREPSLDHSPVKKRRNHRLTNEVDRSFNSDSD